MTPERYALSWRLSLLLALSIVACSAEQITFDVPIQSTTRSVVIGFQVGQRTTVHATNVDAPMRLPTANTSDDAEVVALLYDAPLDMLDLRAGPLAPAPTGDAGRPLPPFDAAFRSGVPVDWQPVTADPAPLADFRLPSAVAVGCPAPMFDSATIETVQSASFAVSIGDGTALVGINDGRIVHVQADRTMRVLPADRAIPVDSAYLAADGRLWFGGSSGRVVSARWTDRFVDIQTLPQTRGRSEVEKLAAGDNEVFVLTRNGAFERFDGSTWTVLHRFDDVRAYSGLLYLGPGHAVAAAASKLSVVRYKDGKVTEESLPSVRSGISALGLIPGFGLLASTSMERALYQYDGAAWTTLPDSDHDVLPCALAQLGDGVLIAGQSGQVAYYDKQGGLCFSGAAAVQTQHYAVPLGAGALIVGDVGPSGLLITFASLLSAE